MPNPWPPGLASVLSDSETFQVPGVASDFLLKPDVRVLWGLGLLVLLSPAPATLPETPEDGSFVRCPRRQGLGQGLLWDPPCPAAVAQAPGGPHPQEQRHLQPLAPPSQGGTHGRWEPGAQAVRPHALLSPLTPAHACSVYGVRQILVMLSTRSEKNTSLLF